MIIRSTNLGPLALSSPEAASNSSARKEKETMVKKIATFGGFFLVLAGLVGLAAPGALGMAPSVAHNFVHLVSGSMALYLGLKL